MSDADPIRVFLVADHAVLRQNLELLLASEGLVMCGWAGDATAARHSIPAETDLVIVALSAASRATLQLVREIRGCPGAPPSLVLSTSDDCRSVHEALAAGARAYVPGRKASEVLTHAIREVVMGRSWTPPA